MSKASQLFALTAPSLAFSLRFVDMRGCDVAQHSINYPVQMPSRDYPLNLCLERPSPSLLIEAPSADLRSLPF